MTSELIPVGDNAGKEGNSPVAQFFVNVGALAEKQGNLQAMVLFGMLFTVFVWLITFVYLVIAILMYLCFVMHHIPSRDGSLSAYCRRKIDQSMEQIVRKKVDKALKKENELHDKEAVQGVGPLRGRPTLPDMESLRGPQVPTLSRQTTQASLGQQSPQSTLPGTSGSDFRPRPPLRTETQDSAASWRSYDSNAPLIGAAGDMGRGPAGQMATPGGFSRTGSYATHSSMHRTYTGRSHSTQRSYAPSMRSATPYGGPAAGPARMPSSAASTINGRQTPGYASSPGDPQSGQTATPFDDSYFSSDVDRSGFTSPTGSSVARSYTAAHTLSMRSATPATSYGPTYGSAQPPMPPLPRDMRFPSAGFRG